MKYVKRGLNCLFPKQFGFLFTERPFGYIFFGGGGVGGGRKLYSLQEGVGIRDDIHSMPDTVGGNGIFPYKGLYLNSGRVYFRSWRRQRMKEDALWWIFGKEHGKTGREKIWRRETVCIIISGRTLRVIEIVRDSEGKVLVGETSMNADFGHNLYMRIHFDLLQN